MAVAVVTDSTACLPTALVEQAGVTIVPLHVVVGRRTYAEGVDIDAARVAELLRHPRSAEQVATSRPSPGELVQTYRRLAAAGVDGIVSVHLSTRISGTADAARLAAAAVAGQVEVRVVDTRVLGMAMGYAALAAAGGARSGGSVEQVAAVALGHAQASSSFFYVDTLEHLRRGGRIGAAAAVLGSALAIKPLLSIEDGRVELSERVRTRGRALARLEERCVAAAAALDDQQGDPAASPALAVHHLAWADAAQALADRLAQRLPAARIDLVELGAVLAVHTGPGTLAVTVSPDPTG